MCLAKSIFLALSLLIALSGCGQKETEDVAPDRDPIAFLYVAGPEMQIRQSPAANAPVVATYHQGQSVTVLSKKGDWSEIRLNEGKSGWAPSSEMTDNVESMTSTPSAPRFRTPPAPVYSQTSVHGEIVFDASVSEQGDVSNVTTVSNTTGSTSLEMQNKAEIQKAKFFPMSVGGKTQPFIYTYRVQY